MLQPAKISPETVATAAPTLNFEYGAYAFSRANRAAANVEVYDFSS